MSLDITLTAVIKTEVYSGNCTHNLNEMAEAAGIYKQLWRPDEIGITTAEQLIEPLEEGLKRLLASPDEYKKFNPSNGWGTYESFFGFVANYLKSCKAYPDAEIHIDR